MAPPPPSVKHHEGHGGIPEFTWAQVLHHVVDGVKLIIPGCPTLHQGDLATAMVTRFMATKHHHPLPKFGFLPVRRTDHMLENSVTFYYPFMNIKDLENRTYLKA